MRTVSSSQAETARPSVASLRPLRKLEQPSRTLSVQRFKSVSGRMERTTYQLPTSTYHLAGHQSGLQRIPSKPSTQVECEDLIFARALRRVLGDPVMLATHMKNINEDAVHAT